jgi:tetrahydromethanopterin S-methyltransferase subunit F
MQSSLKKDERQGREIDMRTIVIVTALLMWPGYGALAQDQPMRPGATPEPESEATEALPEVENQRRVEELREELKELLEQSREGAEDLVRDFQVSAGLTDSQIYGIAAGIVVGAVLADLMGGNGLATLALAAGGGALGNWIMSD